MKPNCRNATLIATTVALMFLGSTVRADDKAASGAQSQVKCIGGNSCSGQSACKTASTSCAGKNSCKGKGWINTADAKACTTAGGHVEASAK